MLVLLKQIMMVIYGMEREREVFTAFSLGFEMMIEVASLNQWEKYFTVQTEDGAIIIAKFKSDCF